MNNFRIVTLVDGHASLDVGQASPLSGPVLVPVLVLVVGLALYLVMDQAVPLEM